MNIIRCIQKIIPGWTGAVWDNSYEGIKPNETETRPIPTLAELEAVWPDVQKDIALDDVRSNRAAAYPDFREYLDGIVKGDQAQIQKYIDDCLAVKARYPLPKT
jgi:hypothetical protein